MFLKIKATLWPGEADRSYAAFARRGNDGNNSVMLVIGRQLFFFTSCVSSRFGFCFLSPLEYDVIQQREYGETCPV